MKSITLRVLILFIIGTTLSIRNLPTMALFGSKLVLLYGLAVMGILIPVACIAAELGIRRPESCGIFGWCFEGLSPRAGLLAIWLQWVSTMIWYPDFLAFIANTIAYLFDPSLGQNHLFVYLCILTVYWLITAVNCYGVSASAQVAAACTVFGMFLPMAALLVTGVMWLQRGLPIATHLEWHTLWSQHFSWQWLPPLTAAVTTCLGMELMSAFAPKLDQPRRLIPRALLASCPVIVIISLLGAMTVAMIVPTGELNLIAGTLQAFKAVEIIWHSHLLFQILTSAILIGTIGMLIGWMLSPMEGLRQASQEGLLPSWLQQNNRHNAPQRLLIIQAIMVSFFSLLYYFMPDFNTVYWFLTDLSTELYVMMYILVFIAAWRSRHLWSAQHSLMNNTWLCVFSCIGIFTCLLCITAGFIAPSHFKHLDHAHYALYFAGGMALLCCPVLLFTRK